MDGIVPHRGDHPGSHTGLGRTRQDSAALPMPMAPMGPIAANPAAVKTPGDYFRALRRRIWLVLAVAIPLTVGTSIWTLRQPRIYKAQADVQIDPPQYDPLLSTLMTHDIGRHDPMAQEKYLPNKISMLKSRGLAEKVVSNQRLAAEVKPLDDPAQELILNSLDVRQVPKTNWVLISLEGNDPARCRKVLDVLLEEFKKEAEGENIERMETVKNLARADLENVKKELNRLDDGINKQLRSFPTIGPGGRSILEDQYVSLGASLSQKQARLGELSQQLMMAQMFPKLDAGGDQAIREERIAKLEYERKRLTRLLKHQIGTARRPGSDPAVKESTRYLDELMDEIESLKAAPVRKMAGDPTELILDQYRNEVESDRSQHQAVLAQMQESMPEHQRFLAMLDDRNHLRTRIAEEERKIATFEFLSQTQRDNVKLPRYGVVEPTVPIKPNRSMLMAGGAIFSLALGLGLVMLLEHLDHSVKVPEHVTQGLTLPLLGIVPRIRRTALTHRAGHLWTAGTPDSMEADAFRNIRASLLGIADRRGPTVTLLVTSPKAGDGKSTAALNIAATCARAGERTLLLDVDLRRPTLGDVFPSDASRQGAANGLVDILQGKLAWQQTLRRTELPNLDFIPTGDPEDIPVEILGTLELRQLLIALSHHYDRVILDGPAVLGLADCRMLGRMVDASILVVRAGAHQLMTLRRAKAMLEQSHVELAGVIVNGLDEDFGNWSSYGYGPAAQGPSGLDRSWSSLESGRRDEPAMALAV